MRVLDEFLFAVRNLRHKTAFLLVVVCTLAVSIGGSTAMFTVVNSFLLSSLPFPEADRLAVIWSTRTDPLTEETRDQLPLSPGVFTDLYDTSRAFERIAAIFPELVTVTGGPEPSRIQTMFVTGGFFQTLRTQAAMGRTLGLEDGLADAAPVVVISHGYWKRRFGGDPDVIGRTVTFGGQEHEVVGVMPAEFRFSESLVADDPRLSNPVDLWASFALGNRASQRGFHFLVVVGRLRPESSLAAARQEANSYAEHAAQVYKDTDKEYGLSVVSLSDQLFGHLRPTLLTLLAATGFVVLIACANLATLLLARGQADHSKIAIRLALGASRARIVREVLLESVLVSFLGGLLALPVAQAATGLVTWLNPLNVFQSYPPRMDLRVLAFAVGVSLVAGLLFGVVPALRASRIDAAAGLRSGSSRLVGGGSRLTFSVLVVSQIALATALLTGAGLSVRSLVELLRADLGVDLERVVTMDLHLPRNTYRDASRKLEFFRELLERTENLPGVESVGINYALPFSGVDPSNSFVIEGRPPLEPGVIQSANLGLVNADYFKTLGIPLLQGRPFRESDTLDAPLVALIDQRTAELYFSHEEPIGRRISIAGDQMLTIIGVVGAVQQNAFKDKKRPYVYLPYQQRSYLFTSVAVKTSRRDLDVAAAVRGVVRDLDEKLPISNVSTLERAYWSAIAPQRFSLLLIGVFASLAFFLTQAGTYGVMNLLSKQRQREAGIRMALGAKPRQAFGLIAKQGLTLSLVGTALGLAIAAGAGNAIASLVYGVETLDPLVFSVVPALTLLAAFFAYYLPARSLSEVDPSESLRSV